MWSMVLNWIPSQETKSFIQIFSSKLAFKTYTLLSLIQLFVAALFSILFALKTFSLDINSY